MDFCALDLAHCGHDSRNQRRKMFSCLVSLYYIYATALPTHGPRTRLASQRGHIDQDISTGCYLRFLATLHPLLYHQALAMQCALLEIRDMDYD